MQHSEWVYVLENISLNYNTTTKMKIKDNIHFIVKYEVYPFDLLVSINEDWNKIEKILKSKLPTELHNEISENKNIARTTMFSGGATLIRMNLSIEDHVYFLSTLQHEIFHAVNFLMDKIDISLSDNSDEAYAYMIGYITKKIYNKILC
jgi:hypothetical protein